MLKAVSIVTKGMYFTVAILSHENSMIYGDLHSPVLKKSVQFHDLTELILMMDKIMQDFNIPPEDGKHRSFTSPNKSIHIQLNYQDLRQDNFEENLDYSFMFPKKSKDIFTIKVMYRQNNTWQGEITWVDKEKTKFFRSALELIVLIYSIYYDNH